MSQQKTITRRNFIKKTSAFASTALAFPYIVNSKVLAANKSVPPSEKLRLGCIGLGGQGTQNMNAFISNPDVQLVALCDVNKGSDDYDMLYQFEGTTAGLMPAKKRALDYYAAKNNSAQYSGIDTYHDYRQLLQRQDIDIVSVCTPDHWHGLVSLHAAKAGKDIYCEKPLTNTIPEGRAVCDAVKKYKRILQTGSHERSNDTTRYAAELVRNGRLGKLHTIEINMPVDNQIKVDTQPVMPIPENFDYDYWLGPTPKVPYTHRRCHFYWRYQLAYGGGEMTDRGAHIIDLAQMAMDTDHTGPVEIIATGQAPQTGLFDTFDRFQFECKYENGVIMKGQSSGTRGLKLIGTEGWIFIHIHGGRLEASDPAILQQYIYPDEIHLERSPGHHRDFLNCVKTRNQPVATAEIGHRTGTICHLLNIAMQSQQKLIWDPVTEQITNNENAHRAISRPMRSPWRL